MNRLVWMSALTVLMLGCARSAPPKSAHDGAPTSIAHEEERTTPPTWCADVVEDEGVRSFYMVRSGPRGVPRTAKQREEVVRFIENTHAHVLTQGQSVPNANNIPGHTLGWIGKLECSLGTDDPLRPRLARIRSNFRAFAGLSAQDTDALIRTLATTELTKRQSEYRKSCGSLKADKTNTSSAALWELAACAEGGVAGTTSQRLTWNADARGASPLLHAQHLMPCIQRLGGRRMRGVTPTREAQIEALACVPELERFHIESALEALDEHDLPLFARTSALTTLHRIQMMAEIVRDSKPPALDGAAMEQPLAAARTNWKEFAASHGADIERARRHYEAALELLDAHREDYLRAEKLLASPPKDREKANQCWRETYAALDRLVAAQPDAKPETIEAALRGPVGWSLNRLLVDCAWNAQQPSLASGFAESIARVPPQRGPRQAVRAKLGGSTFAPPTGLEKSHLTPRTFEFVVRSVSAAQAGWVTVSFEDIIVEYDDLRCRETNKIDGVRADGSLRYRQRCVNLGKKSKTYDTPAVRMPAELVRTLTPGTHVLVRTTKSASHLEEGMVVFPMEVLQGKDLLALSTFPTKR